MNKLRSSGRFWPSYIRESYVQVVEYFLSSIIDRLLPQFDHLAEEADQLAAKEYQRLGSLLGFGEHDMGELAERAEEVAVSWYLSMRGIKQSVINLHAVGLRHLFEQQIWSFTNHSRLSSSASANFKKDINSIKKYGIDVEDFECWPKLEELRLVSNVVKHAEGKAARDLKKIRRDVFVHPQSVDLPFMNRPSPVFQPMAGEDIYVSVEDLRSYADAIKEFWTKFAEQYESLLCDMAREDQ